MEDKMDSLIGLRGFLFDGQETVIKSEANKQSNQMSNSAGPTNDTDSERNKSVNQLSVQSTAGISDMGLFNVITMSPNMSAAATSPFNQQRSTAPCTLPVTTNISMNSPPTYSISGQHVIHQPASSNQFGSCVSAQQCHLNRYHSNPTDAQLKEFSPDYRPQRPASTPSSINDQNNNSQNQLQNSPQSSHNSDSGGNSQGSDISRTILHHVHSSSSPTTQSLSENTSTHLAFSSPSDKDFAYKISKAPAHCTTQEMSSTSPLLMWSVGGSGIPLTTQDPSTNQSHQGVMAGHTTMSSSPDTSSQRSYKKTGVPTPSASVRSMPSPSLKTPSQPTNKADGDMCFRTLSTSSGPNTPSRASSVNSCASPQVSDLGSEDGDAMASQQSFAQIYASLTPWTAKLTSPDYVPLPKPASDAMPIPLENINKGYMLAMSPSMLDLPTRSHHSGPHDIYSRLQPGMGASSGHTNDSKNKSSKNGMAGGPAQSQKANFKILPNKEHRFKRTADALQKSGLWEVAMKTGNLLKRNRELQKELEQFRADALTFLKSVIKNPQNRDFIKNVLNNALASNNSPRTSSSVMTVVVSAAAAAAAASVKLNLKGSSGGSMSSNVSGTDSVNFDSSNVSGASSEMNFFSSDNSAAAAMGMDVDG